MTKQRRSFSAEFKREAADLVLKQNHIDIEASRSLGVGESALRRWVDQVQQERQGVIPQSKALTPEQKKIQELEARIAQLEREKTILKKGYRALDVGRSRAYAPINQLSVHDARCLKPPRFVLLRRTPDVERLRLRNQVSELDLVSKQPGSHAYKRVTVERLDIPNILNREFDVPAPNQVWCGDITSGRWIWLRSNEEDPRACCFTRIKGRKSFISPAAVALSHTPEIQQWVGASSGRRKT